MSEFTDFFQNDVGNFFKNDVRGVLEDVKNDSVFKDITGSLGSVVSNGFKGFSSLFGNALGSANQLVTSLGSMLTPTTMYLVLGCVAVGGLIYLTKRF
jgi:phage-related protein